MTPPAARRSAWGNRLCSAALAAAAVATARGLEPDATARAELLYAAVVVLGYGHLLGAACAGRAAAEPEGRRRARAAAAAALVTGLFAGYVAALRVAPALALPLLLVSTWHTAENDLALAEAYRSRAAVPLPRGVTPQLAAAGATALLVACFAAAGAARELAPLLRETGVAGPGAVAWRGLAATAALALLLCGGSRPAAALLAAGAALLPQQLAAQLSFAEAFAFFGLYHLLSWILLLAARGRAASLLAAHSAPVVVGALLWTGGDRTAELRAFASAPAVYLFWSVLHVLQTAHHRVSGQSASSRPRSGSAPRERMGGGRPEAD